MRVAHVITRLIVGGAQENTLYNVDDQHHLFGDEVCLITGPGLGPEGSLEQRARDRGLDLRVLPEFRRSIHPYRDWIAWRALCRELRRFRPQIVHTHSSKAGIVGRLAAHRLGIPAVHSIHGASFHYGQSRLAYHTYRYLEKLAAGWCQRYISVCDAMSEQYVRAGIAEASRFTTVYSGMDVDQFLRPQRSPEEVRRSLGFGPQDIVVGKVARLFGLKGHEYLIEAAPEVVQRIPAVRFLLVGDGILREEFRRRIAELGLARHFVFAGLVAPEAVSSYLHAMDIVVHASVWEGLARVLPQAGIAGKPVISFAIDGAPEVCLDDQTGILVPPRSIPELSAAIIRLAEDPALRLRLGMTGRTMFSERFRHEHMTAQIREVYRAVLDEWRKTGGRTAAGDGNLPLAHNAPDRVPQSGQGPQVR